MQHHPLVRRSTPDLWIVICPECQRDKQQTPAVGINLPVSSRQIAEMLAKNHARPRGLERKARWIASAVPRGERTGPAQLRRVGWGQSRTPHPPDTADTMFAAGATNSPRRERSFSEETTASPLIQT